MTIETTFKENDLIFFISERKVLSSICRGFVIERKGSKESQAKPADYETRITYLVNKDEGSQVNIKVEENNCFASKEELLKSL